MTTNTVCTIYFHSKWTSILDGAKGVFPDLDSAYKAVIDRIKREEGKIYEVIDIYNGKIIETLVGEYVIQTLEMGKF